MVHTRAYYQKSVYLALPLYPRRCTVVRVHSVVLTRDHFGRIQACPDEKDLRSDYRRFFEATF
jgi:hypothetical protein